MGNFLTIIESSYNHCLSDYFCFNRKQKENWFSNHSMITQYGFGMLFLFFILPMCLIVAQTNEKVKPELQESGIFYTPQLSGSSPLVKPTIVNSGVPYSAKKSSGAKVIEPAQNSSVPMKWSQLMAKANSTTKTAADVPIYTGLSDQCAPQVISDGNEIFVVFENFDTTGGRPFGNIRIYQSIDNGSTWSYWYGVYSLVYHLYSPQIVVTTNHVFITYQYGPYLETFRRNRIDGSYTFIAVPSPSLAAGESVLTHRMVSDIEQYPLQYSLYLAFLVRRLDGSNDVFFTYLVYSTDTLWTTLQPLGTSKDELNKASIGIDYGRSGLYLSYLGTGADAGNIVIRKSTNWGGAWGPKQILPVNRPNPKVGPMVAAVGYRVAIVYQYDYYSNAVDWKTPGIYGDFDVYAVISSDGGATWRERFVGSNTSSEILPSITHDADSSFYVAFIRDDRIRISSAGDEIAFSAPDSVGTINVSLDFFPSIFGTNFAGTAPGSKTAYVAWTETFNGLDIFGAEVGLKILPRSPTNLGAVVTSTSELRLTWTDNSNNESGFLIFRRNGTASYTELLAFLGQNETSYQVSGLNPSIHYEFYVRAYNGNGISPSAVAVVSPSPPAATNFSGAEMAKAYRIFSVPYDLANKDPFNFFPSSLGEHAKDGVNYYNWRFQRYRSGNKTDYEQLKNDASAIAPGNGFFLIVRDQQKRIVIGARNEVNSTSADFLSTGIALQSGWNLVGTPTNANIPWSDFIISGGYGSRALYDGSGPTSGWYVSGPDIDTLRPWSGLAVRMNTPGTLALRAAGEQIGWGGSEIQGKIVLTESSVLSANPSNWVVPVNAYRSDIDMRCEGNGFGMVQNAKEGYDGYDMYIPPFVGDRNVVVYFSNPDGEMMQDIRPLNTEGGVWEMHVMTGDAGAKVKLQFGENIALPNPVFEAYIIDLDQKMTHNLKEITTLEINSGNGVRNFRVVVGTKSYVEQNTSGVALTPSEMKLYVNYPNPFNPETVIRYTVPNALPLYSVTLKIFNVLGQEIVTLVNEQQKSGYYEIKWDARQQSSGIYFYQIIVDDGGRSIRDIKKMVLMK